MAESRELNIDHSLFLERFWQRQPLLIRNAIAEFNTPATGTELLELGLNEEVESRLIETRKDGWHLQHGPFAISDYTRAEPWTLLVQAVDHYLPRVAALRQLVGFIPSWRIDDIMVSYASDGGSVGPHYDNYDVFLLQGEGQRLWKLGQHCHTTSALLPHPDLRILENFETTEEHLLGPGDIIYVPPGTAHWGIARGECTTFSIGFRAPRVNDMLSRCTDQRLADMEQEQFYSDSGRSAAGRPGEILPADRTRALAQVLKALEQDNDQRWFGELLSEPRYDSLLDDDDFEAARALLTHGAQLVELIPAAKLAWQQAPQGTIVFANGNSAEFGEAAMDTLVRLCGDWQLSGIDLRAALRDPGVVALLEYLLEEGVINVR